MIHDKIKKEFWQLFRYGVVGASSFALTATLYALFSRVLWPDAERTFMNVLANGICAIFNFLAHQHFTYKAGKIAHRHVSRYLFVLLTGFGLNGTLFWTGHELLQVDDRIVFVLVAMMVPFYTYLMHRQFTFKHKQDVITP